MVSRLSNNLRKIVPGKLFLKIETAKNLLKLGVDIKTIVKATGLKRKEVEKLIN